MRRAAARRARGRRREARASACRRRFRRSTPTPSRASSSTTRARWRRSARATRRRREDSWDARARRRSGREARRCRHGYSRALLYAPASTTTTDARAALKAEHALSRLTLSRTRRSRRRVGARGRDTRRRGGVRRGRKFTPKPGAGASRRAEGAELVGGRARRARGCAKATTTTDFIVNQNGVSRGEFRGADEPEDVEEGEMSSRAHSGRFGAGEREECGRRVCARRSSHEKRRRRRRNARVLAQMRARGSAVAVGE